MQVNYDQNNKIALLQDLQAILVPANRQRTFGLPDLQNGCLENGFWAAIDQYRQTPTRQESRGMNDLNKTDNRTAAELRLKEQEAEEQIEVLKQARAVAVECEQTSRNEANRLRPELTAALARADAAESRVKNLESKFNALVNGPQTLNAKWLDPECWDGCQSLIHKARVKELEAKCEDSERACAEMRRVIECERNELNNLSKNHWIGHEITPCDCSQCVRARFLSSLLSLHGKGYKSPAEVREMLPYLHHLDSCHMPAAPCTCGLEALVKEMNSKKSCSRAQG